MTRTIGVLNAGSSSVKFSTFAVAGAESRLLYQGELEEIGTAPHSFATREGARIADEHYSTQEVATQQDAVHPILDRAASHRDGLELIGVGHRVVHGGPIYSHRPTGRARDGRLAKGPGRAPGRGLPDDRGRYAAHAPPWAASLRCKPAIPNWASRVPDTFSPS
jgi:hypothetical protein